MIGFPGPALDDDSRALLRDGAFGAILFRRNVAEPAQVADLCRQVKEAGRDGCVLAVDQEGGRVARLRGAPFTSLPPMRTIGEAPAPEGKARAERIGRLLAFELRAVGFDWNFAPVLDVDTNPHNPVIGDRAFSRDPAEVARLGVALARGLEAGGVGSCAKHFPGHGDTAQDSHFTLPRLPHTLERLRQVELLPFHAYAQAGLASVMTAHVLFDALEPGIPATMSHRVLTGILRQELGFQGLVVSDDLEMKAVTDHYPLEQAVVQGVLAGVDLFLICHRSDRQRAAIEVLEQAVVEGQVPRARIEESGRRLEAFARRFARRGSTLDLNGLGSPEHRRLAQGLDASVAAGRDPTEVVARRRP